MWPRPCNPPAAWILHFLSLSPFHFLLLFLLRVAFGPFSFLLLSPPFMGNVPSVPSKEEGNGTKIIKSNHIMKSDEMQ